MKVHLVTYLSIILLSSISLGSVSAWAMDNDAGSELITEKQPDAEELNKLQIVAKTIAQMVRSYVESYPLIGGLDRPEFIKAKYQQALKFFDSASSDSQPYRALQSGFKILVRLAMLGDEREGSQAAKALININMQEHPTASEYIMHLYQISKAPESCTVIPEGCEIIRTINIKTQSPELRRALLPFDSCAKPLAIPTGIDLLLKLCRTAKSNIAIAINILQAFSNTSVGKYWILFLVEREDLDDLLCMYEAAALLDNQHPAKKMLQEGKLRETIEELKKQSDQVANLKLLIQLNKHMNLSDLYEPELLGTIKKYLAEEAQIEEAVKSLKNLEAQASCYEKGEYARVISSFQQVSKLHGIGEVARRAEALGDNVLVLKIFSKFTDPSQKSAIIGEWPFFEAKLAKLDNYDRQEQLVQDAIIALKKITNLSTFMSIISALEKKSLNRIGEAAFYAKQHFTNVMVLAALKPLYMDEAAKQEFLSKDKDFAKMMEKYEIYLLEAQIVKYIDEQLAALICGYSSQDQRRMNLAQNEKYQGVLKAIQEKKLQGQVGEIMKSLKAVQQCRYIGYEYCSGFQDKLQSKMEEIALEVEQIIENEPKLIHVHNAVTNAMKK